MREDIFLREEICTLVEAQFDASLDAEQAEQLEELIVRDPLAFEYYLEHVGLCEKLSDWSRSLPEDSAELSNIRAWLDEEEFVVTDTEDAQADTEVMCDLSELDPEALGETASRKKEDPEDQEAAASPMLDFLGDYFKDGISFLGRNIVLLTVLLPLLGIFVALLWSPTLWKAPPQGWALAARVVESVDCQWKCDSPRPGAGSFLIPGQTLNLELGLLELEFASGARVVLQGPAEFTVTDENLSTLNSGRLTAIVPSGAEGFTVETPMLDVIDLGTEFGVLVEEDGNIDVHVFKGMVETKIRKPLDSAQRKTQNTQKKSPQTEIRLVTDQAVQYDKQKNKIFTIPVDKEKFVRSLSRNGVTENLRVINPSFELPDIRTVPEFQKQYGATYFRLIYGWNVSDRDRTRSRVAMYQISPFESSLDGYDVRPGATDGEQVVTISLGAKASSGGGPRSNWMYQSLGVITSADLGKSLKLSVDAGPRSPYGKFTQTDGTVSAGFALHVTPEQRGTVVGTPASFQQKKKEIKQLHPLEASVSITPDLVGQELFILLAASDGGNKNNIYQYFFDNVKVVVEE